MKKEIGCNALKKLADGLLKGRSNYDKLKEIGNRKNYPAKVKKLKQRLTDELRLWLPKGPSARLSDIEKDIQYISQLLNKTTFTIKEMTRIDELVKKHPIDML